MTAHGAGRGRSLDQLKDWELLSSHDPDGARFAVFYRRHVEAVLGLLAREGVDAWTAADVTAEVFAAAALTRCRFDPDKGEARSWVLAITRHKLGDSRRRWVRERRLQKRLGMEPVELTQDDIEAYHRLADNDDGTAVSALRDLPPHQRAAVAARVIDEEPYAEVSRQLGVTEQTSRQHVRRGLQALRRLIAGATE